MSSKIRYGLLIGFGTVLSLAINELYFNRQNNEDFFPNELYPVAFVVAVLIGIAICYAKDFLSTGP